MSWQTKSAPHNGGAPSLRRKLPPAPKRKCTLLTATVRLSWPVMSHVGHVFLHTCSGRGSHGWKGARPLSCGQHTPGAAPKYPDPGQQGNDLSGSQGDRIWSGAGFFPPGFPNPPTTCLNFSLWRDLSVWRIWGGYFGRWRSGWGGVLLTVGRSSPPPFEKTNCALDYDSPLGFAVILSSRWGKAGLGVDFLGSSFDGPS